MVQKVSVQDGIIVYTSTDETRHVNMGIKGNVTVTRAITVGDSETEDSYIRALGSGNIRIVTNAMGDIMLTPASGNVVMDGIRWPKSVNPPIGAFLAVSATNRLNYCPLVLGTEETNILTSAALVEKYPNAVPGQIVLGPTVIYLCVDLSSRRWRIIPATPA